MKKKRTSKDLYFSAKYTKREPRKNTELSKMALGSPVRLIPAIRDMAGAHYRNAIRGIPSSTLPFVGEQW